MIREILPPLIFRNSFKIINPEMRAICMFCIHFAETKYTYVHSYLYTYIYTLIIRKNYPSSQTEQRYNFKILALREIRKRHKHESALSYIVPCLSYIKFHEIFTLRYFNAHLYLCTPCISKAVWIERNGTFVEVCNKHRGQRRKTTRIVKSMQSRDACTGRRRKFR